MAEVPAAPRSPLASLADALARAQSEGVTLAERPALARFNLRLDPADTFALDAVATVLGAALPLTPNTAADAGDGRSILWLGPDEWLVSAPAADGDALAEALGAALAGRHHAVCDVSAMYTTLALSGPRAREVLMKGCRLDLHPRALAPGGCMQTTLARTQAILHQSDDAPAYEITVRNSFSVYVATWLLDAMAEYRPACPPLEPVRL